MSLTVGLVAAGVLLFAFLQRRNLKRGWIAGTAQINKFSRWLWRVDPIAVYQAEVDKSAEEIREAGDELAEFRGQLSGLQRRVADGEKKVEELRQKVKDFLLKGNENKAGEYVMELQAVQTKLDQNKETLTTKEATYQANVKKIKFANQKIREAREKAEQMKVELQMKKADAEIERLGQNFKVRTSSLDNLSEIEEEIYRQMDHYGAKGQVIHDLGDNGFTEEMNQQEEVQKAKAQKLLEQFKQELLPSPNIEVKILPPVDQHERN